MNYNSSNRITGQATGVDKAIAGLLVAGVTFVLGYTVVRASLAASAVDAPITDADAEVVVGHQGTMWKDVSTQF
ncbi:MAG: hypothetical protein AAFV85_04745 [Cyanobacteria bacterium J06634_6]